MSSQLFFLATLTWVLTLLICLIRLIGDDRRWSHYAVVATAFGAGTVLLLGWGYLEAAMTIKAWGRNIDSGVFQSFAALFVCVPGTVIFTVVTIALWNRQRSSGSGI
jgi:uncharacterized membrane protein